MTDAAKIARGLTKAQREAMVASHWSARQGVGLQKLGLTYWGNGPHGKPMIKFRQIGLAVRAELERNNHD